MARRGSSINKRKEALRKRMHSAVKNRNEGFIRKGILDLSKLDIKLYKPKSGREKNLIDIIPFKITQKWYKDLLTPKGEKIGLDIGETDYKLEIPVHRNVGPGNDAFICNRMAFGQKCYRCEEYFTEKEKGDLLDSDLNKMKFSWRDFYIISDKNDNDKIEIWLDVSFHNFEKYLLDEAELSPEEIVTFADLEAGSSIQFKCREEPTPDNKGKYLKAHSIDFIDRDDPYPESIIDEVPSLDSLVTIHTYEEIEKAAKGIIEDEKEEEEEDENGDDDEEENGDEDDLKDLTRKELKKIIKDEDLNIRVTKKMEDNDIRKAIIEKRIKKRNESPFDSSDNDKNKCPFGHTFGKDAEETDDCAECDEEFWQKCCNIKEGQ